MSNDPFRAAYVLAQSSTAVSAFTLGISLGHCVAAYPDPPKLSIPPVDHPVHMLIGRAATTWSRLEHTLDLIIWDLASVEPERGACITAQMLGTTNRYKTIISLLRERKMPKFDNLAEAVDALMKRTFNPQEDRNRIIHDAWYMYDDKTSQFRAMPPKDPRFGVCSVDVKKIEDLISVTEKLTVAAGSLWNQIHTALEASLQTREQP